MLIMTTIDDLPPEGIPYITDKIIDAGAKNVHIINALTKKGRMEYIVLVDFEEEFFDDISSLLALEFGTIGMKIFRHEHKKFPYELIEKRVLIKINDTKFEYDLKIKYLFSLDNKLISLKAEYEDLKLLARDLNSKDYDISFSKLKTIIEAEAYKSPIDSKFIEINL